MMPSTLAWYPQKLRPASPDRPWTLAGHQLPTPVSSDLGLCMSFPRLNPWFSTTGAIVTLLALYLEIHAVDLAGRDPNEIRNLMSRLCIDGLHIA